VIYRVYQIFLIEFDVFEVDLLGQQILVIGFDVFNGDL